MTSQNPNKQDVSLKLPTLWPDSAKAWIMQTNAQFSIKRITSTETKFYYCVAALLKGVAENLKCRPFDLYFRKISRIPEPWPGKLMSCGKTVKWLPFSLLSCGL